MDPIQPEVSSSTRVLVLAIVWLIWLAVGALLFDLPRLVLENRDPVVAFAEATSEVKLYIGIWVLGSVTLCTMFIMAIPFIRARANRSSR